VFLSSFPVGVAVAVGVAVTAVPLPIPRIVLGVRGGNFSLPDVGLASSLTTLHGRRLRNF
jgi:hypothetical protein